MTILSKNQSPRKLSNSKLVSDAPNPSFANSKIQKKSADSSTKRHFRSVTNEVCMPYSSVARKTKHNFIYFALTLRVCMRRYQATESHDRPINSSFLTNRSNQNVDIDR